MTARPERIESTHNPFYQDLCVIARGGDPEQGRFLVEGEKLIREAIASGLVPDCLLTERAGNWRGKEWAGVVIELKSFLMKRLSRLETPPQDICLFFPRQIPPLSEVLKKSATVVVLDHVQDPGNVGAIIRSMEALGADLLILLPGSCSPVNDKVLRAAMGSAFRVPVFMANTDEEVWKTLFSEGFQLVATDMKGCSLADYRFPSRVALILGAEGRGVRPEIIDRSDECLKIPILAPVESLNVATATAICLYERLRQKKLSNSSSPK